MFSARKKTAAAAALVLFLCGFLVHPYLAGAAFVVHGAAMQGTARTLARWQEERVPRATPLQVPARGGPLRAYAYLPPHVRGRGVLIVPGVHGAGIDEPRLVNFAEAIAAEGHPVLSVELPDLKHYQITTQTTDMIEDAARLAMRRAPFAGADGRIGVVGISFGGGLALVAAGRPAVRDGIAFVLSFGGYGDLPRTLRYLLTGVQPNGVYRAPHDYGVAIVTLNVADRLVPPVQVAPLRAAILSFLEGSRLDMVDKLAAAEEFARARGLAAALPEPAATYMRYVNARDVAHLGPVLLPHIGTLAGAPSLSEDRSAAPTCPIYLLHGSDDNVVPAIESELLARDLRAKGRTVHLLVTPLITHAEFDRASTFADVWRLIAFWSGALSE